MWEAETGRRVAGLAPHKGEVKDASFSPDGQWIITSSWDRTARLWPVYPLALALKFMPRDLTMEEKERFEIGSSKKR